MALIEGYSVFGDKQQGQKCKLDISTYGTYLVYFREVYLALMPFVFGAVTEHIITDIGKYSVGRLRPHFFDVCRPDLSKVNCSGGYIMDFECQSDEQNKLREMRLVYTLVFIGVLVLYAQN